MPQSLAIAKTVLRVIPFKIVSETGEAVRMCMPEIPNEIFMAGLEQLMSLDKDWIPNRQGSSLYIRPFMMAWDTFLGYDHLPLTVS